MKIQTKLTLSKNCCGKVAKFTGKHSQRGPYLSMSA